MFWNKNKSGTQTTVKEYWQATDALSRPLAIVLALLVIFICIAVIFSLFMGGRWLYGNINGKNDEPTKITNSNTNKGTGANKPGPTTTTKSSNSGNGYIGSDAVSQPKTTQSTPTPTTNKSNNIALPNSGPSELPNTGPGPE